MNKSIINLTILNILLAIVSIVLLERNGLVSNYQTIFSLLLVNNIIIFIVFVRVQKKNEYLKNFEILDENLEPILDNIRSLQHDYKNLGIEDVGDVDEYLICENVVLNTFFYSKYKECLAKNIDFKIEKPFVASYLPFDKYEVLRVFGNLIDNAIEATEENGHINISFLRDEENYVYSVRNSNDTLKIGDIDRIFKKGVSTKVGDKRGYGLSNTHKIVSKYGSKIVVELEENEVIFEILIPRNSKKRGK